MNRERRLAFLILKDVEEKGAWANLAIAERLKKEGSGADAAFVRELVYSCVRNQTLLDHNIAKFLKKPGLSASDRVLLRMGFCQMALMDGVADHAAINETVAIASAFMKGRQGFINAVLRSFQRSGKELKWDSLATKYSCAPWIEALWTKSYGAEKAEALMRASNTAAPFVIRANTLKISREELAKTLENKGFSAEPSQLSKTCLKVLGKDLLGTEEYQNGLFSVQGEASAAAVELLSPKPGEVLLDLCAAPGGKSCCAAELMENRGAVRSFDLYPHRAALIKKEAARLGLTIIEAKAADSQSFSEKLAGAAQNASKPYPGTADCVLADVPCSGLGTLRRNPEIKLKAQSPEDASKAIEELAKIQYNILLNALSYAKAGGRVLYSTCTINPAENEEVVNKALRAASGRAQAEYRLESTRQIFTQEGGPDGFFTALIKRLS